MNTKIRDSLFACMVVTYCLLIYLSLCKSISSLAALAED